MTNFQDHELTIELDESTPGTLRLVWLGMSTHRTPASVLRPWFDQLFAYALTKQAKLEMDFLRFEHMNSSTISALVHIIHDAQAKEIPLTLRYAGDVRWQKLSFDALSRALRPFGAAKDARVNFVAVNA